MFTSVSPIQRVIAKELLSKPKEDLYRYYLKTIASPFVLSKTELGKKRCFQLWTDNLKRQAEAQQ